MPTVRFTVLINVKPKTSLDHAESALELAVREMFREAYVYRDAPKTVITPTLARAIVLQGVRDKALSCPDKDALAVYAIGCGYTGAVYTNVAAAVDDLTRRGKLLRQVGGWYLEKPRAKR